MLPGIRFLFAAVVFAVSLVIFGMGAAALLRSAHEEFASLPTRRIAPPAVFAQQPVDPQPTLSMLRVETPLPDTTPPPAVTAAPTGQEPPAIAPPVETEQAVDVPPIEAPSAPIVELPVSIGATKSDNTTPDAPERAMTVAVAPAAPVEAAAAPSAVAAPASVPDMAAPAVAQPPATLTDSDARLSSSDVADLGEPAVISGRVPLPTAKPIAKPVRKVAKKPAPKKRRVAAARPVAAAAAEPADPFGQPFGR